MNLSVAARTTISPEGAAEDRDGRDQDRKQTFHRRQARSQIYASGQLQKPRSPYELMAGTVISAALVTGINPTYRAK